DLPPSPAQLLASAEPDLHRLLPPAHAAHDLGDLPGRDLVHLQSHLGTETVAFAHKGARTVGLDFSREAVEQARRIARREGVEVDYVRSNVYDAVSALGGRRFDVVYTGKGALCYLPDLPRWASVVAELLKPGGLLYIVEFHPVLNALGPTPAPGDSPELLLRHDYLEGRGAIERDATYTYTDGPALRDATRAYEWAHGLGEVITALVGAGLEISGLRETELLPWPRWERMVRTQNGQSSTSSPSTSTTTGRTKASTNTHPTTIQPP
ncbi:MAG: class I SAM-dependent methyltransferase, partial [Pseudonocardiaceae bacterium]